jgi:hypothetical protein
LLGPLSAAAEGEVNDQAYEENTSQHTESDTSLDTSTGTFFFSSSR